MASADGDEAREGGPLPAVVARLRSAGCVFAEQEARLLVGAASSPTELAAMVARRVAGRPLELVLGWVEFGGLRITVEPGVFVPRRRTQLLAREAASLARGVAGRPSVVVELCCGVGAVAAVLSATVAGVELYAADLDPVAVRCARRNLGSGARVFEGDLYACLPTGLRGRVDVVVANAPYVPTAELPRMPPEARLYEPRAALDGGPDGLDVLRRITAEAPTWLAPGGALLVEAADAQLEALMDSYRRHGLRPRVVSTAEPEATVVIGER